MINGMEIWNLGPLDYNQIHDLSNSVTNMSSQLYKKLNEIYLQVRLYAHIKSWMIYYKLDHNLSRAYARLSK